MADHTYYCEVKGNYDGHKAGIYKIVAGGDFSRLWFPQLNKLIQVSDRVWKQGPRGGVKIIKDRSWPYPMGYIKKDDQWMKKFFWIKLKAKSL
jgi:hypothetical protein